jgi:hypothetical protein
MAESSEYPGAPRWVKVFAAVGLAALLGLGLFKHLSGPGHGHGRHGGSVRPSDGER